MERILNECKSPFFSIAIPSRNRAGLARRSAHCALKQTFIDFEVIVLDNSECTDLSTAEFNDPRCRVVRAPTTLSMPQNWERAIDESIGEYLMILSDKDMLIPTALERIYRAAVERTAQIVTFRKAGIIHGTTGFVQVCSGKESLKATDSALRAWFHEVKHQHNAPMVYNSAVKREFILEQKRDGQFFVGSAPDVASGIILGAATSRYVLLDRALVLSVFGEWSIGRAASNGRTGAAERWLAEFSENPLRKAGLVEGVIGAVAETMMACKSAHPDTLKSWHIHWARYVKNVLRELSERKAAVATRVYGSADLWNFALTPYGRGALALGYASYLFERAKASDRAARLRLTASAILRRFHWHRARGPYAQNLQVRQPRDQASVPPVSAFVSSQVGSALNPENVSLDPRIGFEDAYSLLIAVNEALDVRVTTRRNQPSLASLVTEPLRSVRSK